MPAWVIVDEFNTDDLATSWALDDAKPLGRFTRKFMSRIASEAARGDPRRRRANRTETIDGRGWM
ncbi:hypothetical protein [Mesorhizobium temperatum]|uniref:hypothetical protein n=1 Tax=Mesorhizobium temperatum TaxID=241416 RepID=UPI001FDA2471|nr:hypothetical protein [Mesorhizobium temperatum]